MFEGLVLGFWCLTVWGLGSNRSCLLGFHMVLRCSIDYKSPPGFTNEGGTTKPDTLSP